jgi:hypothetical protein
MILQRSLALGTLCLGFAFRSSSGQSVLSNAQLCVRRDSLMSQTAVKSVDDAFEVAARLLPGGFGGLTTTYFFLKQPAFADSVRGLARTLSSCLGDTTWRRMWDIVARAEIRQGQYDWLELRHWYAVLLNAGSTGLYSSDIDEGVNRLSYGFATTAALELFQKRADALGVPAAALILKVESGTRWPVR